MTFTIADSYRIRSRAEMRAQLQAFRVLNPHNAALHRRSLSSLVAEWCGHNLLYDLRLFRAHTADVDLEYPQAWYLTAAWYVLAAFYWRK